MPAKVSDRQTQLGKHQRGLFEFCFENEVDGDECTSLEERWGGREQDSSLLPAGIYIQLHLLPPKLSLNLLCW